MIVLENVSASYGQNKVLDNLSFSVQSSKSFCIIGPNGSGKTTLLKILAGLIPYSGSVKIFGEEVSKYKRINLAKRVALMEQLQPMAFSYTVYDTVLLGRYGHSKSRIFSTWSSKDHTIVKEVLKKTELWDKRDRLITELSGGQRQQVFFARTLVQNPDIILLDEPTNHLDLRFQVDIIKHIKDWTSEKGKSIIGVLHDLNLALTLAEEVLVLNEGKLVAKGSVREVLTRELLGEIYKLDVVEFMLESLDRWESYK